MNLKWGHLFGTLFTLIAGTLLHFTYEWSGYNYWAGLFSATSESTWQHLKLLFVPMLFYGIIEIHMYGTKYAYFVHYRLASILIGILLIIGLFYGYQWLFRTQSVIVDIGIFVVAVIGSYLFSYVCLRRQHTRKQLFSKN